MSGLRAPSCFFQYVSCESCLPSIHIHFVLLQVPLIRLAASAGIVTWVATGGNPGNLLGLGGGRSLKRPEMAEKEAPQKIFRDVLNSSVARSQSHAFSTLYSSYLDLILMVFN